MIKNERYLLITLPVVALLGGFGIDKAAVWLSGRLQARQRGFRDVVLGILFSAHRFALGSFFVVGFYYRFRLLPDEEVSFVDWESADASLLSSPTNIFGKDFERDRQFEEFPSLKTVRYMNDNLPRGSVVLAARPADFYYLEHRMMSYLDSRLLPVYNETDPIRAHNALLEMGVTHINLVDYYLPPFYNSVLGDVVADPSLTALVHDNQFTQVYELRQASEAPPISTVVDFSPPGFEWAMKTQFVIGGRKALSGVAGEYKVLPERVISEKTQPLFHRDYSTLLMPTRLNKSGVRIPLLVNVDDTHEYRLELDLEGRGFVRVWAAPYEDNFNVQSGFEDISGWRLYETVLSGDMSQQTVKRRFRPEEGSVNLVFRIEHVGRSRVQVNSARLVGWEK